MAGLIIRGTARWFWVLDKVDVAYCCLKTRDRLNGLANNLIRLNSLLAVLVSYALNTSSYFHLPL